MKQRTTLVIAHRPPPCCCRATAFCDGERPRVEQGTHAELAAAGGLWRGW